MYIVIVAGFPAFAYCLIELFIILYSFLVYCLQVANKLLGCKFACSLFQTIEQTVTFFH